MKLREKHLHSPRDVSKKRFSGRFHKNSHFFLKKTAERWLVDAVQLIVLRGYFNF